MTCKHQSEDRIERGHTHIQYTHDPNECVCLSKEGRKGQSPSQTWHHNCIYSTDRQWRPLLINTVLLTCGGDELCVQFEGHDGFGQVPKELFNGRSDRFGLPFLVQVQLVRLFPVQSLIEQFGHFREDADDPVKALFLQPSGLQDPEASRDEGESGFVEVRFAGIGLLGRVHEHGLLAVHGVQPETAVLLSQCLEGVDRAGLVLRDEVEAESLVDGIYLFLTI